MPNRREFTQTVVGAGAVFAVTGCGVAEDMPVRGSQAAPLEGHFHPKGKAPSKFTLEVLEQARATRPRCRGRIGGISRNRAAA